MEHAAFEQQPFVERTFEGAVDAFLGHHHRRQRHGGDDGGGVHGLFKQLVGGNHARDETGALGLLGAHHAGGQRQVHGLGLADGARQSLRAASAGNHAQLDFGLAELGRVGRDDDVAHHGKLAAAAQRIAGHRGDHGLADALERFPVARDVFAAVHVHVRPVFHGADVSPRREGLFATGDDDAADVGIGLECQQRGAQFVHELIVQRVERLGTIQRQQADSAPGFDQYKRLAHECLR